MEVADQKSLNTHDNHLSIFLKQIRKILVLIILIVIWVIVENVNERHLIDDLFLVQSFAGLVSKKPLSSTTNSASWTLSHQLQQHPALSRFSSSGHWPLSWYFWKILYVLNTCIIYIFFIYYYNFFLVSHVVPEHNHHHLLSSFMEEDEDVCMCQMNTCTWVSYSVEVHSQLFHL